MHEADYVEESDLVDEALQGTPLVCAPIHVQAPFADMCCKALTLLIVGMMAMRKWACQLHD
jgi:hypothetical protein